LKSKIINRLTPNLTAASFVVPHYLNKRETNMNKEIQLPIEVKPEDIDYEFAKRAHSWNSFNPSGQAKRCQKEYADTVKKMYYDHFSDKLTDRQKQVLDTLIVKFRDGFKKRYEDVLSKRSRTASSMVTGPANFPVEKNRKKLECEERAIKEMLSYRDWYSSKIAREIERALTPEEQDQKRAKLLIKAFNDLISLKKDPGIYDINLFKASFVAKLERSSNSAVVQVLEHIKNTQENKKVVVFTQKHRIWKMGTREEKKQEVFDSINYGNGYMVEPNYEIDRILIHFPGIPSEETRTLLKSTGWKWSRKNTAWQRKITKNAYSSAKNILINTIT
jgi:transposase-like protein